MGLTQLGVILIPLCLMNAFRPDRLLQFILVFSVFEAAAAIVLGSVGVQPGLAPATMLAGFVLLQLLLGAQYPGTGLAMRSVLPFILTTAFAVATSYVMPEMFDGAVLVWPQKFMPGTNSVQPLHFSVYNLTQDMYLLANCVTLTVTALYTTSWNFGFRHLRTAYFAGAFMVVALSFWQLGSRLTGIYYPTDFLHSNPGWMLNGAQELGSAPRIDASFSEPSSLALYLAGVIYGCAWSFVRGDKRLSNIVLFGLALLSILLSTSSTGFITLIVGVALLIIWSFLSRSAALLKRTWKMLIVLVSGFMILSVLALVLFPPLVNVVGQVIDSTINKSESASYQDRTGTDQTSLLLVGETFGFGVGWGSNRSSSLIPGILAGLGVPGTLLLAWFIVSLIRAVLSARPKAVGSQGIILDLFMASVIGQLVAACVSSPTISSPEFFAKLGIVIGCTARIELNANARACDAIRRVRATAECAQGGDKPGKWSGNALLNRVE